MNVVMKATHNLSITVLVKSTYFRLDKLFARKGTEVQAQLQVGAIEFNSKHVNTMNVYQFDRLRTTFTMEKLAVVPGSMQQNYQVLLDERRSSYLLVTRMTGPAANEN
ncbi:hypothetical protein AHAS_Ahas19G0062500 [Arachis hypogaea]